VAGDEGDIAHDATLPAPPVPRHDDGGELARGATVTVLAPPRPALSAAVALADRTGLARAVFATIALLGAANTIYFFARFVLAASPPRLTAAFIGVAPTANSAFAATSVFYGPELTFWRTALIAIVFVGIALWSVRRNPRDLMSLVVGTACVVVGQFSISVAVLTSSEHVLAWRVLAAGWYMLLPAGSLTLLALFPSGRPVPRWSLTLIAPALVPFAVQTGDMLWYRSYSVPVAALGLASGVVFLGFQHHRYRRRATLREQHQIRWLGYASCAFLAFQIVAVIAVLPLLRDLHRPGFQLLKLTYEFLLAAAYFVPLACGLFASARYRLWDIDRVINRTIVYVLVTALLGGAFAVAFFALDASLRGVLAASAPVALVASLAAAALLFGPTRRRIARWIDRRFYGIGLDYEALAAKAVRAVALPTTSTAFASFDELALLGRGGMGAVYRAHHADFGVPVALKVMSPQLANDPDAELRFRREAEVLEGLRHRNVVPFLASGHERGLAFIAMEYIEGEDLAAVLHRRGRLPIDEVAHVVTGVAAALDAAHARGIVHRDVKPANVLLGGEPSDPIAKRRPYLMDFGVASVVGDDDRAADALVGSLPYIAPEQIRRPGGVDKRADVYALGATAYELLAGRPPFCEPTALGLVMAHLQQPPEDPRALAPAIPAAAADALLAALAKDPGARHASAGELAAALRAADKSA
jgi:predicted Ser/Thr protein kinase